MKLDSKPKTWERQVALYGAFLVDEGAQSATIKSYFSAIKKLLKQALDYEFNNNAILLTSIARACRITNDRLKTRLPISGKLLDQILFEIGRMYDMQTYLSILYKTIFSIAFHGLFRIGEISCSQHVVKAKDVSIGQNKDKLLFVLYSSKTHDKESRPQQIKITKLQNSQAQKKFFCPFELTLKYSKLRPLIQNAEIEQFFVFRDRSPVKPSHLRHVLKRALLRIGINYKLYSFHSLRIGKASQLIDLGYAIEIVKRLGRWKSNAVYKYIRN